MKRARPHEFHATCACGKRSYGSRKGAKIARRRTGAAGLSIYRCERSQSWHIGHTPYVINRGISSRDEFRGGAA